MEEAQAQTTDAEELPVDDDWKLVEPEPETVEAFGNGHHGNGNGHYDLFGSVPAPVNSRREKASEPQQTLHAWAEFMATEPVKAKGRSRNPEQADRSLATGQRDPQSGRRDCFEDGSAADATVAARAQQYEPIRSLGSDSDDCLFKQGLLTSPRNKVIWTLKRKPCAVSQEGPDQGGRLWLTKVIAP